MRKRIPQGERRRQLELQRASLSIAKPQQRTLLTLREKNLRNAIEQLPTIAYNDLLTIAPELIKEPYLNKIITNTYMNVGKNAIRVEINHFLGTKADAAYFEEILRNWVRANTGAKIKIMEETFKEWFRGQLAAQVEQGLPVETMVSNLTSQLGVLDNALEWQVRRIVQTESLTALSVAQSESIKSLNIGFEKVWGISGNNTREHHLEMEGIVIDESEMFEVTNNYGGIDLMEYPRDPNGSAENVINCSCFCMRLPKK